MIDELMDEAKAGLRREAVSRRAAMDGAMRAEAAATVSQRFFDHVVVAADDVVAGYWPLREELDCRPILERLMAGGPRVALPIVGAKDAPLIFRLWRADAPLYPAGFGTLAPGDDAPVVSPTLVLVPLLGFDSRGMRLGYGGGYYDRTLAALSGRVRRIGLGFARQRFDLIPRGPHDVPLDAVITEAEMATFQDAAA